MSKTRTLTEIVASLVMHICEKANGKFEGDVEEVVKIYNKLFPIDTILEDSVDYDN